MLVWALWFVSSRCYCTFRPHIQPLLGTSVHLAASPWERRKNWMTDSWVCACVCAFLPARVFSRFKDKESDILGWRLKSRRPRVGTTVYVSGRGRLSVVTIPPASFLYFRYHTHKVGEKTGAAAVYKASNICLCVYVYTKQNVSFEIDVHASFSVGKKTCSQWVTEVGAWEVEPRIRKKS